MTDIRNLFIGIVLFSVVITGCTIFYTSTVNSYGITQSDVGYFNATIQAQNQIEDVKNSMFNTTITGTVLDVPLTIVSGIYSSLKLLLNSINIFGSLISDISRIIGIPPWLFGGIITIITIIIIFELVSSILKYRL